MVVLRFCCINQAVSQLNRLSMTVIEENATRAWMLFRFYLI